MDEPLVIMNRIRVIRSPDRVTKYSRFNGMATYGSMEITEEALRDRIGHAPSSLELTCGEGRYSPRRVVRGYRLHNELHVAIGDRWEIIANVNDVRIR